MSRPAALIALLALSACTRSEDDGFGKPPVGDDSDVPPTAPVVVLASPEEGQSFGAGQSVPLSGLVQDDSALEDLAVVVWVDSGVYDAALTWTGYAFEGALQLSTGDHTIAVRATDPDGMVGEASVGVHVIADQPPSAPGVVIAPANPVTGDGLYSGLSTPSVDPEGLTVSYDYAWTRDGAAVPEYDGRDAIPTGVVHFGETWAVSVTPSDGTLSGSPGSASVTIGPVGPLLSVSISPDPPLASDTLGCNVTASEPDGQPITASSAVWRVNGVDVGDAAMPLSGAFARGDLVECAASATSTLTTTASASVTVANSPPALDGVSLGGAPATEAGQLTCAVSASDADGDALSTTADWYVNGALVASGGALDGASFDRGDEVWCSATATDGLDTTAALESDHTWIENTPPTAGAVALGPALAVPGALLTCTETMAASDPDPNDALSTTVHWWVNGGLVSSGADWTFDTTGLLNGDSVGCEVEWSDGAASATASASVSLAGRLDGELSTPDVTLTGSTARGYLGISVEAAGDLDGDGLPELAAAGTGYGSDAGAVMVWSGAALTAGTHADTDATWTFTGPMAGAMLGNAHGLAAVGDIDGDNRGELLVGADRMSGTDTEAGAAYLLLSSESGSWASTQSIDSAAALEIHGDLARDHLGGALGGGDLDGDGVADLLVGAGLNDVGAATAGQVALFYDPSTLSGSLVASDADVVWTGSAQGDRLGLNAVAVLGDLDGDGYPEVALGAPTADGSLDVDSGVVYLLSASNLSSGSIAAVAAARIDGFAADDNFGMSLTGLGDLDADGLDDFAVGARFADVWVTDAGGVYVWFGGAMSGVTTVMSSDACWGSGTDGDRLGYEMSAGDVDGDGLSELALGTYARANGATTYAGGAWLLLGSGATSWPIGGPVDDLAQAWTFGAAANSYLGRDPAILGDVNGDGFGEWVVAAQSESSGASTRAGKVFLYYGP